MRVTRAIAATIAFAALLLALGYGVRHAGATLPAQIGFPRAFTCFALLLAPLWFSGFGGAEPLKRLSAGAQISCAGLLALPYFVFSLGTATFYWRAAVIAIAFPVLLAAFLGLAGLPERMTWRDVAVLAIIVATYYLKWLQSAWPYAALAVFPKLFLADVALYCFLVVRKVDAGYSLAPNSPAFSIGVREWALYIPFALVIGKLTGFIHFHAAAPGWHKVASALLVTFLLIAIPEELFFRGILQNLLESRLGRGAALAVASLLFGLSHFNHGVAFNWKYVLLASIAGLFYGRAWRANRQILASVVTHTMVDVVWSLWFR